MNLKSNKLLTLFLDKLFLFFLTVSFLFLICMFTVSGIFLFHGISELFVKDFSDDQIEKTLFDLIKGIEFIFIAAVPYLLMLSVQKYFKIMFLGGAMLTNGNSAEPNYEMVQKTREEILFVRSLIVSIFIAVVITHMISHMLKAVVHGQLDLPLSATSIALLIALIFYYAQVEKGLPPNVKNLKPKND